ncbi:MAG: rRNA pseudouridine synthase [Armatimonadetes bacterium]|nr:rRNA pseudouridine synthase [Armatimonadota bacterium]
MEQRLQKVLAAAGVGSRRHCEALIASGRVAVNGRVVTKLGTRADPEKDVISIDGKPIDAVQEKIYVLLNKPPGYTSTRFDRFAQHTVMELVDEIQGYLYPVGRLDADTSGALLLTNDGELANLLTHPSHQVEKTYLATVKGRISSSSLDHLARGVNLDDGPTAPAKVKLISYSDADNTSAVEITIHEGRKRQVKRMFQAVGHRVVKLTRTRFGCLDLKGLPEGEHRFLTKKEVAKLKRLARHKNEP